MGTTAVSITADRSIEPCEVSGCEGGGSIHTAEANYGTTTGDDAQGAEVLPRDGILGGGNEEAAGEADQTGSGGLVDGVMGGVGLVRLQVELGAAARLALHGVGRCELGVTTTWLLWPHLAFADWIRRSKLGDTHWRPLPSIT
jgi:hypothetical protein